MMSPLYWSTCPNSSDAGTCNFMGSMVDNLHVVP